MRSPKSSTCRCGFDPHTSGKGREVKRRAFFGFAAGAAVAGPQVAKAAAAKVAEDLALGSGANALLTSAQQPLGYGGPISGGPIDQIMRANTMLEKIAGMTAAKRAEIKRRLHVGALDPDLAAYRSMSIGARIEMQRERQFERMVAERKGFFEVMATGADPYNDEPL